MSLRDARFERLYQAEVAWILRTVRRLGVLAADAPDVTHDVFVAVHGRLDEYDPARPVRPWLFAFAFRVVAAYLRRRRESAVPADAPDDRPGPDESAAQAERRAALLAALATLDLDARAVVVLCDLEGLAAPAAAELLEVPVNTVYSRLRTARARLTDLLRRGVR